MQEQNLPQEILHTEQEVIAHSCDYSHFSIFEEFESSGVSQSQNNCSLQVATGKIMFVICNITIFSSIIR